MAKELSELLTHYDVDQAHAHHVAQLALDLFDRTQALHQLPPRARRLLEIGALLHNVGLHINQPLHHVVGRDIVLDEPLDGMRDAERAVVACLVMFHRKKVRPDLEPAFLRLGRRNQVLVLRLAALLRIADGLDYSQNQMTQIADWEGDSDDQRSTLYVSGAGAEENARRAAKKADLWQDVGLGKLYIVALANADMPPAPEATPEPDESTHALAREDVGGYRVSVAVSDGLAAMGRRLLRSYFRQLLQEERGVRSDDSVEPIHQMRVATRRLRAILQIIRVVAPEREVRYFRRELQQLARALAPVRDADVFLEAVQAYAADLPAEPPADLRMLLDALHTDRDAAYARALAYLDSERHARFKRDFATFMTDPGEGWQPTVRVRDAAGSIIWQHYEGLRAYEQRIDVETALEPQIETLHEARIAGKRLRYVLEMFRDVNDMASPVERVLKPLVATQEYLGSLQDIAVATHYIAALEAQHGTLDADVATYRSYRQSAQAGLLEEFPRRWNRLLSEPYRRDLAQVLVLL